MERGETGAEILAQAEGRAEVVIESEPSGAAQSLFEQRDGKWVGNVEGSEMELTMQDEQVLSAVLALEIGDPAIVNTAEGFNLTGDPVTWTAIYERTDAGIMTTHREEPRDASPTLVDALAAEEDDIFQAPELSTYTQPENNLEVTPGFGEDSEKPAPAKNQLWFERASAAEDEMESKAGADIIDFFSRGRLFETAAGHDAEPPSISRPKGQDESKDRADIIEAAFGAPAAKLDRAVEDSADTNDKTEAKVPAQNNVVELFVGSAELVLEPTSKKAADVLPEAITTPAEIRSELDIADQETQPVVVTPDASLDTKSVAIEPDLTEPEAIFDGELEGALEIEQVEDVIPPEAVIDPPILAEASDIALEAKPGSEISTPLVEISQVTQQPAEVNNGTEALEADITNPDIELAEPETVTTPPTESFLTSEPEEIRIEPKQVTVVEQILQPANLIEQADNSPQPEADESEIDQPPAKAPENVPAAVVPSELEPAAIVDETQNVIRLETAEPEELDLSASDWAAEFGAPAVVDLELESVSEASQPKREVRIRRHESGMLDITVTFETEGDLPAQTKAKKAAAKTMRRAA